MVRKCRKSSSWPPLMQCYTFCGSQECPFFRFGRVQLKCDSTLTHGRGIEGETGECSGKPVPFTLPQNMVYPALLQLMR